MEVFKITICPYLNALATLVDIRFCYSLSYQLIYECQNQDAAKNTLPENAAVHTITSYYLIYTKDWIGPRHSR